MGRMAEMACTGEVELQRTTTDYFFGSSSLGLSSGLHSKGVRIPHRRAMKMSVKEAEGAAHSQGPTGPLLVMSERVLVHELHVANAKEQDVADRQRSSSPQEDFLALGEEHYGHGDAGLRLSGRGATAFLALLPPLAFLHPLRFWRSSAFLASLLPSEKRAGGKKGLSHFCHERVGKTASSPKSQNRTFSLQKRNSEKKRGMQRRLT